MKYRPGAVKKILERRSVTSRISRRGCVDAECLLVGGESMILGSEARHPKHDGHLSGVGRGIQSRLASGQGHIVLQCVLTAGRARNLNLPIVGTQVVLNSSPINAGIGSGIRYWISRIDMAY